MHSISRLKMTNEYNQGTRGKKKRLKRTRQTFWHTNSMYTLSPVLCAEKFTRHWLGLSSHIWTCRKYADHSPWILTNGENLTCIFILSTVCWLCENTTINRVQTVVSAKFHSQSMGQTMVWFSDILQWCYMMRSLPRSYNVKKALPWQINHVEIWLRLSWSESKCSHHSVTQTHIYIYITKNIIKRERDILMISPSILYIKY